MKEDRFIEITKEAHRRVDLWLDNSTFKEMSCQYSQMRFEMALGMAGYPFEKESWMNKEDFKRFITDDEFEHPQYNHIVDSFFNGLLNHKEEI